MTRRLDPPGTRLVEVRVGRKETIHDDHFGDGLCMTFDKSGLSGCDSEFMDRLHII